ncbi:SDR family NAD(P)-dependent oxidoreductase [Agrococcus sp. SL85]|uniref:SDR family NAD(P)-dependent oxidoreductase n=1 Tax=Agrococcus sp. SL85 TaxID=2995141 RepID=UPI00226D354E|nr:SDR family NAD(P)-dependent oxidoreductase [Agrococcus sp. SL85]WAC66858.1 SDR family NAD(P)-dependent oxidoreductase [Agrococcus sp. SL85]
MGEPKVVVLTGASAGIGAAAARSLSAAGHEVVVVGRSPERTRAIADEIGARHFLVDLEEALSVRDLAARLLAELPRIDVLALNAGALYGERRRTVDGHERTWQVNVLSPALLSRMLLPRLRESEGRVVLTSSAVHRFARLEVNDLEGRHSSYSMLGAYGSAKLAGLLLLDEAAKRAQAPLVGMAAFHPGYVASHVFRDVPVLHGLVNAAFSRRLTLSPEEGSVPLQYLATVPTNAELHQTYWHRMQERRIRHPQWHDVQLRAALREAVVSFDTAIV